MITLTGRPAFSLQERRRRMAESYRRAGLSGKRMGIQARWAKQANAKRRRRDDRLR